MKKKSLSARKIIHNFYLKKLQDPKIKKVYGEFKKNIQPFYNQKFCISVSGGSDSMALAFLAKCFLIEKKINALFCTVDHKLRKASKDEAQKTKKILKSFNINCKILNLKTSKSRYNIQENARLHRYDRIFNECKKYQINIVLTAHQRNDLCENYFIRLLRGSGLKGLISFKNNISSIDKNNNFYILRPLLNVSRDDLKYIVKNTFKEFISDPSNENDKFFRIKIRKLIENLKSEGLNFNKFNKTLDNLNLANKAIEFYVKENISNNSKLLNHSKKNKKLVLNERFFKQPDEIIFRSLIILIHQIGNKSKFTRGSKLSSLIKDIQNSKNFTKRTLSGCIFEKISNSLIISREI